MAPKRWRDKSQDKLVVRRFASCESGDVNWINIMREGVWGSPRRGYHHGNLRETLIEAARHLIAVNGCEGFTLIEAARLADVSPAAPYRHFPDRQALVEAVRQRGFMIFADVLAAAGAGIADPMQAFRKIGAAYLTFARDEPGYYGAMFEARKSRPTVDQTDNAPGETAFAILASAVGKVLPAAGGDRERVRLIALGIWALSHGVAMLARNSDLPSGPGVPGPEEILERGVLAMIAGAGTNEPR